MIPWLGEGSPCDERVSFSTSKNRPLPFVAETAER